MAKQELDQLSGQSTTGHEWDGLKELNTPLPKWWLWVFYATIVWSIGYWVVYPSWPLVSDYTKGLVGAQMRATAIADYEAGKTKRVADAVGLAEAPLEKIKSTPAYLEFAMANGKAAFGDNCAPCHGSGATGGPGYPNLQDDDWIWGGKLADIYQTLQFGIRSGHAKARDQIMPAFGKDAILKKEEIADVAAYVVSLSDSSVKGTDSGKKLFADNCGLLPWRQRQGQPGDGRAEPDRQDLALRRRHRQGRGADHRAQARRHAGVGRSSRPDHHQVPGRLRPLAGRRQVIR